MLTIISVKFGSSLWLEKNLLLCQQLNPDFSVQWLIVNNDAEPLQLEQANIKILPAVPRVLHGDKGSFHHAAAIMSALPLVKTRFLLVLDHDFYVLQKNWLHNIVQHMQAQQLGFFGSVWHPRWTYQYRYFPSVHCMLIDLEKIPLEQLDFTPDIGLGFWDQLISTKLSLPANLRKRLQVGQFKDTGSRIQKRFANRYFECLTPHFLADTTQERFLFDRFSLIPKKVGYFTRDSFLQTLSPLGYEHGWEEFFWQNQPFAFHLRMVGRTPEISDETELTRVLTPFITRI